MSGSSSDDHRYHFGCSIDTCTIRDTADSVGIIPERLSFTTSNTIVRTVRHAVSLDERRAKFRINLWNRPSSVEAKLGTVTATTAVAGEQASDDLAEGDDREDKTGEFPTNESIDITGSGTQNLNTLERLYVENEKQTDVLEVWFAVCSVPSLRCILIMNLI